MRVRANYRGSEASKSTLREQSKLDNMTAGEVNSRYAVDA